MEYKQQKQKLKNKEEEGKSDIIQGACNTGQQYSQKQEKCFGMQHS